jgi:hypothetical protein
VDGPVAVLLGSGTYLEELGLVSRELLVGEDVRIAKLSQLA